MVIINLGTFKLTQWAKDGLSSQTAVLDYTWVKVQDILAIGVWTLAHIWRSKVTNIGNALLAHDATSRATVKTTNHAQKPCEYDVTIKTEKGINQGVCAFCMIGIPWGVATGSIGTIKLTVCVCNRAVIRLQISAYNYT